MKRIIWFIFCILISWSSFSQKEDYIWVIGDSNNPNTTSHGGMLVDFNYPSPIVSYHYREINMFESNASICDSNGNLLFYTNGCDIADRNDQILLNGYGLNPGYMHDLRCDQWNDGYGGGYSNAMILPFPETDSVYYIFHKSSMYIQGPPEDLYNNQFLYTVVHINSSTGQGYVTEKNVEFMSGALAFGETGAVKHANGIDWWLITPKRNSNQFYVFLFTAAGIVDTLIQSIGGMPPPEEEGSGQNCISPDGSLLVRYYPYHPAMLYDFDRATGQFSNYRTVNIDFGTALAWDGGCAFSPSGRFLYISAMKRIYQFDLWANDVSATQTTVAIWDGFISPIATNFYTCQLGPDCKIYIIAGGDTRYYHIIHNPDEGGLACNVEQHGLILPTPSGASIPYFPNYRLGPIDNPGPPCTPTVGVNPGFSLSGIPTLRAWPNPASEHVTLEWGETERDKVVITLYDVYGREMKRLTVTGTAGQYTLAVGGLPTGLYRFNVADAKEGNIGWGSVLVNE